MKRIFLFIITILVLNSCKNERKNCQYELKCADKYFEFNIGDHIKLPQLSVFQFTDKEKEYISFKNGRNEIVIYDLQLKDMYRRMIIPLEGDNAIPGGIIGFYVKDLNNIYIPGLHLPVMYLLDSIGVIKQKIDYSRTSDRENLIPTILKADKQMQVINNILYLPQMVNPMHNELMMEKSRTSLYIDTLTHLIKLMPMKFPPLITIKDRGTSAGFGAEFSVCFDGNHFVYSFFASDLMYRTSPEHEEIEKVQVKSQYIDKVEVLRMKSTDANKVVRGWCDHPAYGSILYDKYREVYYRFVYPKSTLEADYDPFDVHSSGRKRFSIMILDKELNIIGETLFPDYTYNSHLFFILEDGLYLSTSHIKNPNFSDDVLTFQRIDLVRL